MQLKSIERNISQLNTPQSLSSRTCFVSNVWHTVCIS